MGNPNAVPSDQTPINHFSHPHPLQLLDSQTLGQILHCSACKLDASGPVYTCKSCHFVLHPKCYQLPQQLQHPFHQNHALILQPKPIYSEGLFCCDACGNEGGGFSYHCSPCGVDLHTTCAFLNMEFTHQCHNHKLNLTFSAPYPGNTFSCDVCKRVGSKTWIYRCNGCQFDVHVNCVAKVIPAPQIITTERSTLPPNYVMNPPNVGGYGAPMPPQHVVAGQPQYQFVANPYPAGMPLPYNHQQPAVRPAAGGGLRAKLAVGVASGIGEGFAQAATGFLLQEFLGGGGGGDDVS